MWSSNQVPVPQKRQTFDQIQVIFHRTCRIVNTDKDMSMPIDLRQKIGEDVLIIFFMKLNKVGCCVVSWS